MKKKVHFLLLTKGSVCLCNQTPPGDVGFVSVVVGRVTCKNCLRMLRKLKIK